MSGGREGPAMPGWSQVFSLDRERLLEEADDMTREEPSSFDEKTEPPEQASIPPAPPIPGIQDDESSQTLLDTHRGALSFQDRTVPTPTVLPEQVRMAELKSRTTGDGEMTELDLSDAPLSSGVRPGLERPKVPAPPPAPIVQTVEPTKAKTPEPVRIKLEPTGVRSKPPVPDPATGTRPKLSLPPESSTPKPRPSIPNEGTAGRARLPAPIGEPPRARLSDPPRGRPGIEPLPLRRRDEVLVAGASASSEGAGPQIVRHAPSGPIPPRTSEPNLLENAPVVRTAPIDPNASAELTQINAAAALGIAPEPASPAGAAPPDPNAPPAPPPARAVQLPGAPEPIHFGDLRLAEKEEVLARYPVEAPGLALAERLGDQVPVVKTVSKVIPLAVTAFVAVGFITFFLVGPIREMTREQTVHRQVRELPAPPMNTAQPEATPSFRPAQNGPHELPPGAIKLRTSPSRASVEVDGFFVGRTPLMLASPEGDHVYDVRLRADGHAIWQGKIAHGADPSRLEVDQVVAGVSTRVADLELESDAFSLDLKLEAEHTE
ncbi:MAG: PEGA domain-containing protein [Myxococcota bacterium]